jgi:DNA-directed RNA polymerase subunit RPC12/RpoP
MKQRYCCEDCNDTFYEEEKENRVFCPSCGSVNCEAID